MKRVVSNQGGLAGIPGGGGPDRAARDLAPLCQPSPCSRSGRRAGVQSHPGQMWPGLHGKEDRAGLGYDSSVARRGRGPGIRGLGDIQPKYYLQKWKELLRGVQIIHDKDPLEGCLAG